jgi:uncharacterized protein
VGYGCDMASAASVTRINVTPVKGTRLISSPRATVGPTGLEGNRTFFFVDASNSTVSCSDRGPMLTVSAAHDRAGERLRLEFPDGHIAEGPADDLGEHTTVDMYGRDVAVSFVLGPFDEPMSALVGQPVRLARADLGEHGNDVCPITIVSLASVEELGRRGGHDGPLDPRRFRMNLELDGCEPFEEDTWSGATVHVGTSALRVLGQVPRCRAVTLSPVSGEKDWDTLSQIVRFRTLIPPPDRGIPFGMYAEVVQAGEIEVGDQVEIASARERAG